MHVNLNVWCLTSIFSVKKLMYISIQEFCKENQWPPLKNMMTVKGKVGQSCKDACWNKGAHKLT